MTLNSVVFMNKPVTSIKFSKIKDKSGVGITVNYSRDYIVANGL